MSIWQYFAITLVVVSVAAATSAEQHHKQDPKADDKQAPHHAGHFEGVSGRGDKAMGFDHLKTSHHFRLHRDGGAIEVEANEQADTASRDQIRGHLASIARSFASGDFSTPMFIHDRVPPGVEVMKRQKAAVSYRFDETERGGRVKISTSDAEALKAIHEFLRFQIEDHRTGDPMEIR
jgi:hypothetical protein